MAANRITPSRLPTALLVVFTVALAGLLPACARDEDRPQPQRRGNQPVASPISVSAVSETLNPPGTPLGNGLEVQTGSALVGTVFPLVEWVSTSSETTNAVTGWQALLLVDGNGIDVWNRYAEALGIAERANAMDACFVQQIWSKENANSRRLRLLTEDRLDKEDTMVCFARLEVEELGFLEMFMAIGAAPCGPNAGVEDCPRQAQSHLFLKVNNKPSSKYLPRQELGTTKLADKRGYRGTGELPTGPVVAPHLNDAGLASSLPGPGERIDAHLDDFLGGEDWQAPPGIVPTGALSLITPAMLLECNGGVVVVMKVPGSPVEALTAMDSVTYKTSKPRFRPQGTFANSNWAGFMFDSAGGYYLSTTALDAGDAESYVLATQCGD